MPETANPVRQLQTHLRQAGALIAARQFDEASEHIDHALALDPASLAALTLRDRLQRARAAAGRNVAPPPVPSEPASTNVTDNARFIPSGVNAASWLDFEQRIQDRRYRALIESAQRAIAAGDGIGARTAIEEARELRPESGEVAQLSSRAALLPLGPSPLHQQYVRSRTMRAASILLIGVTLLLGLDWFRAGTESGVDTVAAADIPSPPPIATASAIGSVTTADLIESEGPADVARGTSGTTVIVDEPVPATEPAPQPLSTRLAAAPPAHAPTVAPRGEIPDDYVARRETRDTVAGVTVAPAGEIPNNYVAPAPPRANPSREPVSSSPRPGPAPAANVVRQPGSSIVESLPTTRSEALTTPVIPPGPPPVPAASAAVATRVNDETLVHSTIDQYARAFGQLDARAAKAVWPTVDEGKLARAFSDLQSQDFNFDQCDIAINGATASASCRGKATFSGKVGGTRTEPRTWRFDLKREGESWKISKAETRK